MRPIRYKRWLTGDIEIPANTPRRIRRQARALRRDIARAARYTNTVWHFNSFVRDAEKQRRLWAEYLARDKKPPLVAPPGSSQHEKGGAADVSGPTGEAIGNHAKNRKALRRFGLCLPVPGEPWHIQRGDLWRA